MKCQTCRGSGKYAGALGITPTAWPKCPDCNGTGSVANPPEPQGEKPEAKPCPECQTLMEVKPGWESKYALVCPKCGEYEYYVGNVRCIKTAHFRDELNKEAK